MSIEQKYFDQDKNHLLKTVQAFGKDFLIKDWLQFLYEGYQINENPMGLEDAFTLQLRDQIQSGQQLLEEPYDILSAIYRLKHGDNQLMFMWDGRTHMEFYDEEWRKTFHEWTKKLSQKREIYRCIIKMVIASENVNTDFLVATIRKGILDHFDIKLTRSRKIHLKTA